jgi:hypothetical protein
MYPNAFLRTFWRPEIRAELFVLSLLSTQGTGGKDVLERWKTAAAAAGCPGLVPHVFRRTAVRNLNRAGVPESVAMKITGHLTRSVFDRYDITSEEDLTEATRKLQALTGTIAGTKALTDAEALQEQLANSVKGKGLLVARDRIELSTLRFSVVCSTN